MLRKLFLIVLFAVTSHSFANEGMDLSSACQQPKQIQKIENWAIVAYNVAYISTSKAFAGNDLTYSVLAHPQNSKNQVSINRQTGKIRINADGRDKFDVVVSATNACGRVSATFNVQIDEEN